MRAKMKSDKNLNTRLMKKATSSKHFINRANSNRAYAKNDFNLWISTLLDRLCFSSVLDVCCGSGNQLVLYAAKRWVTRIIGVDVSEEALCVAKERLAKMEMPERVVLKAIRMEKMFSVPELRSAQFDLISCFYGLYYSQNAEETLEEMINHLSDNGVILIVGPYGENNASLFSLLQRHFSLPDLVVRSSKTFMESEVYPLLSQHLEVEKEYFTNYICYPNAKVLVDYWMASTFYFPEYEDAVVRDINSHFLTHKEFVVEKHVLAYIARKKT
jgi:ubiquinone/menaquinone biosynthesis C-methylase UbiE